MSPSKKIGLAMSGGIDSTLTALLLQESGYEVHGFFMLLPLPQLEEQKQKVSQRAEQLGIPLSFVDLRDQFERLVIDYFLRSYEKGLTPNPCVFCNRYIKFDLLIEQMLKQGMDLAATGHYARIKQYSSGPVLLRAMDRRKDQSYFLCRLAPKHLSSIILPLGEWQKTDVYQRAAEAGLIFTEKESQDVCFLSGNLRSFLQEKGLKDCPGYFIDQDGREIGRHNGIFTYTIGQRRGLGFPDATPWYVTGIDAARNQILLGKNDALYKTSLSVSKIQWFCRPKNFPWKGLVQLRSTHTATQAELILMDQGKGQVNLEEPQRAITPGQFAAFYDGVTLIGSAVINAS